MGVNRTCPHVIGADAWLQGCDENSQEARHLAAASPSEGMVIREALSVALCAPASQSVGHKGPESQVSHKASYAVSCVSVTANPGYMGTA